MRSTRREAVALTTCRTTPQYLGVGGARGSAHTVARGVAALDFSLPPVSLRRPEASRPGQGHHEAAKPGAAERPARGPGEGQMRAAVKANPPGPAQSPGEAHSGRAASQGRTDRQRPRRASAQESLYYTLNRRHLINEFELREGYAVDRLAWTAPDQVRCLPDLLLVFPDSACWLSLRVTYCFWSLLYSYLVSVTMQGSSLQCYCGTTSSVVLRVPPEYQKSC